MALVLEEYISDRIWLCTYGVKYFAAELDARMTVIRLMNGRLMLHSPCEITPEIAKEITALGEVAYVIAPSNFHYLHVPSVQAAFPDAKTYICPGIEQKRPDISFDFALEDTAPLDWSDDLDQALVRGSRWMWEVTFFHKASKTLILVDLIENITDATPRVNWVLKLWWKLFRMWNKALPAPEYRMGWKDQTAAKASLERILAWDFKRIILAHGDVIESDARQVAERAWASVLVK